MDIESFDFGDQDPIEFIQVVVENGHVTVEVLEDTE